MISDGDVILDGKAMLRPKLEHLRTPIGINCVLQRNDCGAKLILSNQKSFSITLPESSILEVLIKNDQLISTKDELIVAAWGSPEIIGSNSLPVAITNLRKVLELVNVKIVNIPRKGYKIQIPEFKASLNLPKEVDSPTQNKSPSLSEKRKDYTSYLKWAFFSLSSTSLALIIISYFSFWHEFEIVHVNLNNQSSQICLTKTDEMQSILASYSQEDSSQEDHPNAL